MVKEDIQNEAEVSEPSPWSKNLSIGYSRSGGNTDDSSFSGEISVARKSDKDEWAGSIKSYISTSNDEMDAKSDNAE